ncbi:MAG: CotH kinase family protein [Bacteroidetes bacterium]|nr:CotH kinase family protein [Bacteroidota bacterium]
MRQLFDFVYAPVACLGVIITLAGCGNDTPAPSTGKNHYFCGAENFKQEGANSFYEDGFGRFSAGGLQVTDSVFEGRFACKLDSLNPYGMTLTFTQISEGEFFETSVWIKNPVGKGTIIAGTSGRSNYTLNTTAVNKTQDSAGWSHYFMSFGIESPVDTLTIFLFAGSETRYFDNFEINRYAQRPALPDSLSENAMHLYIPDSAMQTLSAYKAKALEQDIISSDLKEYVPGYIVREFDSIPVEIRLKGDWTDHLENGKTSYRIKTDQAYRGLTTFSIQHPQTRNYMHEWFMHKLCDLEGLLSTTYDFLPVEINGVNNGIYALEEHFDKQLPESRNRREGPIIKIDETGFWALLASGKKDSIGGSYPYFESAMITCFKEGRTEKSPVLSQQFNNAATLLYLFKNRTKNPEQIFELEPLAKYYALMDLGNIHHSLAWHNRRFYYNPVTTKLEIIGFDMIPAIPPFNPPFARQKFDYVKQPGEDESAIDFYLFANPDFRNYYTRYFNLYSSEAYLDSVFQLLDSEITEREKLMAVEFPNYKLDRDFYYERAAFNRGQSAQLDSAWDEFMTRLETQPEPKLIQPNYKPLNTPFLQKEISVNAYRTEIDSTHFKLQLENFHLADLTVVGYSTKAGEDSVFLLDKPVFLARYDGLKPAAYAELTLPVKPAKIHFTVANIPGAVHTKKVFSWPKPDLSHPRIELEKKFRVQSPLYQITGDTLLIKKGNYVVRELVLIPAKYIVRIEAGTTIDLVNGAGIITNNSTFIEGSDNAPVVITSSDTSAQGFIILGAAETHISHAQFSNLSSLNQDGWNLTGAVTIYEGNVSITHTEISGNTCEDALNIIRGHFNITQLNIHNTHGDAFDADFCTGILSESRFENTGNDCIDFSGSVVDIRDITIRNSGDKGISSGEKSTLTVSDVDIDGALTALASKDGSILTVTTVNAVNCEVGAALYRKKPEYPYSRMTLENATYSNIDKPTLIERGALLSFNKLNLFGYTVFDIDAMYARFEK